MFKAIPVFVEVEKYVTFKAVLRGRFLKSARDTQLMPLASLSSFIRVKVHNSNFVPEQREV